MAKLTIDQVDVSGKRVLTRVDFNVPINADGQITDDRRIRAALPTIKSIIDRGGKLILMSHLGRPEGTGYEKRFSLMPVAEALGALLGTEVKFPSLDCLDDVALNAAYGLANGEILLLENLRFYPDEVKNADPMAQRLATFGEVYCNDAFGTAHRAHASMVGVPNAMPNAPKAAGFLMRDEIKYLSETIENPERPFVGILGGAKVKDKIGAIENMLAKVDTLLIGGAMAYTFLAAMDRRVGKSLVENESLKAASRILEVAAERAGQLFFPIDHVCGTEVSEHTKIKVCDEHIEDGWMGLDIGVHTIVQYAAKISDARTIVWNGPMGVFETKPFDVGTRCISDAVAAATIGGATSVIGGGDSAAAVEYFGMADRFSHVSTGGGASLKMLEGQPLPGVEALNDA
jgi:3-phosphoglycerate kinase